MNYVGCDVQGIDGFDTATDVWTRVALVLGTRGFSLDVSLLLEDALQREASGAFERFEAPYLHVLTCFLGQFFT